MATEAVVCDSAEDVSNLQKDEQLQPVLSETTDVAATEGVATIEDISAAIENIATAEDVAITEDVYATEDIAVVVTVADLQKEENRLNKILSWTTEEVAEWIIKIGFPFYQDCFRCNVIDGRKLILCNASGLCKLGIKDYTHIKYIAKKIRNLLKTGEPYWNVCISDIPRDIKDLYLEQKSRRGKRPDSLTLVKFNETTKETIWQPPLSNLIQSITHNGPHDIEA